MVPLPPRIREEGRSLAIPNRGTQLANSALAFQQVTSPRTARNALLYLPLQLTNVKIK
jgi:hypothetical protein